MKTIPLSNGKAALVSDEDWGMVSQYRWSDRGGGYVRARMSKRYGGDGKTFVYLHRLVMAAPVGSVVDHIDGNPLNNTRENLQIVTQARNCMKSRTAKAAHGVSAHRGKWRARARIDGRSVSLGVFAEKELAIAAVASAKGQAWSNGDASY